MEYMGIPCVATAPEAESMLVETWVLCDALALVCQLANVHPSKGCTTQSRNQNSVPKGNQSASGMDSNEVYSLEFPLMGNVTCGSDSCNVHHVSNVGRGRPSASV